MNAFVALVRLTIKHWRVMLLAAVCGWLTIASNIGLMTVSAFLISSAALHPEIAELSIAIVGVRFFGIARAVFRYTERYLSHDATFRILSQLRTEFFARIEPLAPARLNWHSGELFSSVISDVETLKEFYLRVLAPPVVALFILAAMMAFLAQWLPELAVVLLAAYIIIGILVPLWVRSKNKKHAEQLLGAKAAFNACLVDTIDGMLDITAYDRQRLQQEKIAAGSRRLIALQARTAAVSGLTDAVGSFLMNATLWLVLVLTIPAVHSGRVEGVYLAVFSLAVQSSFEAVLPLPIALYYLAESLAAAGRLFAITTSRPAVAEPVYPAVVPARPDIALRSVSFSYGSGAVLTDVSMEIPFGKRLVLVGPSGSGKSTVANILLRFWDYSGGAVMLGGRDYREFSPEAIRNLFAVVSQQTHVFNASIRENLMLAKPAATEAELLAAVERAALLPFIEQLPQGLDTLVGRNGKELSGGQRQRIAIARAFLRDAPIVLLDEPTVGLDAVTEREIMQAFTGFAQERTVILITHHLAGLELADEVVVLESGSIRERGSMAELLAQKGLFYQMWQLQQDYCFTGVQQ